MSISYGYTSPDNLPYPNNVNDAADVPPALQSLANYTQTALNKKVPTTRKIIAGNGLLASPSETLAQDITLSVRVASPLYISSDQIMLNTGLLGFAAASHSHSYAPVSHSHSYAAVSHGHVPSQVGVRTERYNMGTINAGSEARRTFNKGADELPVVCVQHASSYLFAVIDNYQPTSFVVEVRNSTSSTNHTNVHVHIIYARAV